MTAIDVSPSRESPQPEESANYTPLAEKVTDYLREAIVSGRYKAGDRIRQEAVAAEVGTSRIPVREALNRLRDEGLVTLTAHVGARVARLDRDELGEIYLIRERLEPVAIAHSVPRLSDDDIAELEELLQAMEASAEQEDYARWVDLDRRFHLASYRAAELPRLLEIIEGLWNSTQHYRRAYIRRPELLAVAQSEHREIMAAIARHEPDEVAELCLAHISRTRLTLTADMELFGDDEGA